MFKVRCYYNPIVKIDDNGEMSVSIYYTDGKKTKKDYTFYDRDYNNLMKSVTTYVKTDNEYIKSSIKYRFDILLSLYF